MKPFQGVEVTVCGIPFVCRNQEKVGVRNTSPTRVQGDKLGREKLHDPLGGSSSQSEETGSLFCGQLMPPRHMAPRDDQTMALSERVDVEDGQGELVLENDLSRFAVRNNTAKDTVRFFIVHSFTSVGSKWVTQFNGNCKGAKKREGEYNVVSPAKMFKFFQNGALSGDDHDDS